MGGSTPSPDPQMGQAALLSAQTGQDMLAWMQANAELPQQWAVEDRERYTSLFQPIENQLIADAQGYDTPERRAQEAAAAQADMRKQAAISRDVQARSLAAMGVDPRSGRYAAETTKGAMQEGLAALGAGNAARKQVEATGYARLADAANMGRGMAVNPATSLGLASGMGQAGFQGAMSGYGQQADILNQQYQQQMNSWNASQGALGSLFGGLGSLAGFGLNGGFAMLSSEDAKTEKRQTRGALKAIRNMPVEEWEYREGMGDGCGRRHVGPYAEDFQRETGLGDGRTIDVVDAIGTTMGAVKELADTVDVIEKRTRGIGKMASDKKHAAAPRATRGALRAASEGFAA